MSEKNLDNKNRWRGITVGFRVSQAESEALDRRVRLSGLSKQEYILKRLCEQAIIVHGNPRVYKALRNEMAAILSELQRMEKCGDASDEFLAVLRLVTETAMGMKEDCL